MQIFDLIFITFYLIRINPYYLFNSLQYTRFYNLHDRKFILCSVGLVNFCHTYGMCVIQLEHASYNWNMRHTIGTFVIQLEHAAYNWNMRHTIGITFSN